MVVLQLPALRAHHHARREKLARFLVPEARGATHTAGIAVHRARKAGRYLVGEDVALPEARHVGVQALDVREPAAQHDHVRIEHVDHARSRARKAFDVARERFAVERSNLLGAARLAGERRVLALERRPRKISLDAAGAAAVAGRQRVLAWEMPERRKRKLFWDNAVRLYARCGLH